jgi:hypothetical protein
MLPEVGNIAIEDPWINGTWSNGYGLYNLPQLTPAGYPEDIWNRLGPNGEKYAFCGRSKLPLWPGNRGVIYCQGAAHGNSRVNVNSFGSNNSNWLTIGAWVYCAADQNSNASIIQYWLEEARYDYYYNTGNRYPANCYLSVNHQTGQVQASLGSNGSSGPSGLWNSTTSLPLGQWSYVFFAWNFKSTGVTGYMINGNTGVHLCADGSGGFAGAMPAFTYTFADNNSNLAVIQMQGPMMYASVNYQPNVLLAGFTWPTMTNPTPNAVLDQSKTRINWLPEVASTQSKDVCQAVTSADMGVTFFDEFGIVHFWNRDTLNTIQAGTAAFSLDMSGMQELAPESTFDSVVNEVSYDYTQARAYEQSGAWKATQAGQYLVPTSNFIDTLVLSNAQSIRAGTISWHPQAQGYGFPSGDYRAAQEPGGLGPSGGFTYKDWMSYFGPAFWNDGFTAHAPGTGGPGAQPPLGTGLNCDVYHLDIQGAMPTWPGTPSPTLPMIDTRFLRLNMTNTGATASIMQFSVDDNVAFMNVGGTSIVKGNATTQFTSVGSTDSSVVHFGRRALKLPSSDWHQDPNTLNVIALDLLNHIKMPTPYLEAEAVLGDPRRQLGDLVAISDSDGPGMGAMSGLVVGVHRTFSATQGLLENLTVRLTITGTGWFLDDPNLSQLDNTTYLYG